MLRNYITVAMRSLLANRMHSLINIGGLAVGLAACLLILLFVRDELSYERWLPNADRIVNVETTFHIPGRETLAFGVAPGPVKPTLEKDFSSDVERVVRLYTDDVPVRAGDRKFRSKVTYVDPGFFEVFDLPAIAGKREAALANNSSIVLSQTMARKYFGDQPAVGNTLTVGDTGVFTVVGVFADLPKNTHLQLESIALLDLERYKKKPWVAENWTSANTTVYALLRSPESRARIEADLPAYVDRNVRFEIPGLTERPSSLLAFDLMPILDIHLHADKKGYEHTGSFSIVVAFTGIALLILVIACINFINLATARAMTRAREVALRKVVGATRRQLIAQHLGEAILVALVALVIAIALVELALGPFDSFLKKDLKLDVLGDPMLLVAMLGLIVIVGVVGGLYPAFYLSRFQPATVLKANQSSASGSSRLRTGLVVFQFAISIALIICTTVIYVQTRYAHSFELGFAKTDRMTLAGLGDLPAKETRETLKRELAAVPGVRGVALSSDVPPMHSTNNTLLYPTPALGNEKYIVETLSVDPDFFAVYEVKPIAGRLFANDRPAEFQRQDEDPPTKTQAIVVNRAFTEKLGARSPADVIGRVLYEVQRPGSAPEGLTATTIIGVVPDLHLRSIRDVLTPLAYYADPPLYLDTVTVHFDRERQRDVAAAIDAIWNRLGPTVPIDTGYVADNLAKQYDADEQRGEIFGGFAVFAIVIACLGLFGLASFSAQRRTKEIGMRKVLGASVPDIVRLLVWQFSRPVLLASLIAWPVSFFLMRKWLGGFEYAISITALPVLGIFAGATLIAVAIAWLTTAGHAVHVARANPGLALRSE